jgi:predicted naringenin-chalcone synthase
MGLEKRYFHHTEQLLNSHPGLLHGTPSALDARLDIVAKAAPELAASAAAKAIARWGRPATDITHLVVSTNAEARSPGADLGLATLLGLRHDVCRTVLQLNGCSAGCAALRLAKDLAENNRGARVLVACVELTITSFRAPHEGDSFDTLIPQALFGDGAGAVVVGADAVHPAERPLFEMVSASQILIPGSEHLLSIQLGGSGIDGDISFNLQRFAAQNLKRCLLDAFGALAVNGVEWQRPLLGSPSRQPWDLGPHRLGSRAGAQEAGGEPNCGERLREHALRDGDIRARGAAPANGRGRR